ncbi:thiol-disulfide oxidoreductase DCC family protein [Lutibacter holmesii]|uniref:Thiol-disulfide oxidoreductase DCC family protein n=1 Tax=Lutibacter holmesii TaxID=1137985 RepID=A0ABW3WQV4_9FLAO
MKQFKNKSIVLFDGVCNLCNSSVNFIIKHDTTNQFLFASLQSDAAKDLLLQFPSKKYNFNSVLLIENGVIYDKSTAALLILKHLQTNLKLLIYFKYLPLPIRDGVYNFIAKHRYQWFGKQKKCMLPTPKLKQRFLS